MVSFRRRYCHKIRERLGAFSLVFPYLSVSVRVCGNRFALISGVFLGDSVSDTC